MPVAHLGGSADVGRFRAHGLLKGLVVCLELHVLSGELVVLQPAGHGVHAISSYLACF